MEKTKKEIMLSGKNLWLRRVTLSDINDIYVTWMNDLEVNRYMETRFRSNTRKEIAAYVKKMIQKPNVYFLAIVLKETSSHIGNIKLEIVSPIHRRGQISLFIGEKELWGRGLATQAISLVRDFAISELGLHKLTAGCYCKNSGSSRAFEKAGFTREAVLKEEYLCEGEWVDRYYYAFISNK